VKPPHGNRERKRSDATHRVAAAGTDVAPRRRRETTAHAAPKRATKLLSRRTASPHASHPTMLNQ
jgi:hypothetical protein